MIFDFVAIQEHCRPDKKKKQLFFYDLRKYLHMLQYYQGNVFFKKMAEDKKKSFRKYKYYGLIPTSTLLCDHRSSQVLPSFPKKNH